MKKNKNILTSLLILILACNLFAPVLRQAGFDSIECITAYADDTATGGLEVEDGTGGFVISPGTYPSLNGDLDDTVEEANNALSRYKMIGNFIIACLLLALLGVLIIHITKFAGSGSDERTRKQAMSGILMCGIAIALIGSIALITSLVRTLI